MAKPRKGAVRFGSGTMCNVCGLNCGKGGALKRHVEAKHKVDYASYSRVFYDATFTVLADGWDDTINTESGNRLVVHTLVRAFTLPPGPRGATRSVPKVK